MKRKFYRSCVAVLLSMVMIFGGVNFGAGALVVRPPIISTVEVSITNTQNTLTTGETMQMTCSTNVSGGYVSWSGSDSTVATVSASGLVTAKANGTVSVTATYDCAGMIAVDSITLYVRSGVIGIENNAQYYVMNSSTKEFLSLGEETDVSQAQVNTLIRSDLDISKWRVELQSDGTVQFINVYSPTKKCLTVNGTYLCIDTDTNSATQKFTVERVTSGDYKGLYQIKYGDKYLAQTGIRVLLVDQSSSQNVSYWSFMAVDKRSAEIFAFNYDYEGGTFDTTDNSSDFCTVMAELGYTTEDYENEGSATAYACLRNNDDIFVYRGHGKPGMLEFTAVSYGEATVVGRIVSHTGMGYNNYDFDEIYHINELPDNALCLSRCVLYIGCETAKEWGERYSLLEESFNKGAHFVLGTNAVVHTDDGDRFLSNLLSLILLHGDTKTIKELVDMAQVQTGGTQDGLEAYPIVYTGDGNQYLTVG